MGMPYLTYLILAAAGLSAPNHHPHQIRDATDAIETVFDQLEFSPEVKKEEWAREYTAKRKGREWVVQRKDGSLNVYVDAKTGRILRDED